MCGRYASFRQAQDLAAAFARAGFFQGVLFQPEALAAPASYNVAPTTDIPIIVDRPTTGAQKAALVTADGSVFDPGPDMSGEDEVIRQVQLARWGLVPPWAKDPSIGVKMINARSETVAEKPSFKRALATRRCIIPADGYYEWQAAQAPVKTKTPMYITPQDGSLFAFAGLYEFWRQAPAPGVETEGNSPWLVTATIITAAAHGDLGEIHDRRPVFLTPEHYDRWLNPQLPAAEIMDLLSAAPVETKHVAVSTKVNSVANNDPSLIVPESSPQPEQGLLL